MTCYLGSNNNTSTVSRAILGFPFCRPQFCVYPSGRKERFLLSSITSKHPRHAPNGFVKSTMNTGDIDPNEGPKVSAGKGADPYNDARAESGSNPEIISGAEVAKHIVLGRGDKSIWNEGNAFFRDVVRSRKSEVCSNSAIRISLTYLVEETRQFISRAYVVQSHSIVRRVIGRPRMSLQSRS